MTSFANPDQGLEYMPSNIGHNMPGLNVLVIVIELFQYNDSLKHYLRFMLYRLAATCKFLHAKFKPLLYPRLTPTQIEWAEKIAEFIRYNTVTEIYTYNEKRNDLLENFKRQRLLGNVAISLHVALRLISHGLDEIVIYEVPGSNRHGSEFKKFEQFFIEYFGEKIVAAIPTALTIHSRQPEFTLVACTISITLRKTSFRFLRRDLHRLSLKQPHGDGFCIKYWRYNWLSFENITSECIFNGVVSSLQNHIAFDFIFDISVASGADQIFPSTLIKKALIVIPWSNSWRFESMVNIILSRLRVCMTCESELHILDFGNGRVMQPIHLATICDTIDIDSLYHVMSVGLMKTFEPDSFVGCDAWKKFFKNPVHKEVPQPNSSHVHRFTCYDLGEYKYQHIPNPDTELSFAECKSLSGAKFLVGGDYSAVLARGHSLVMMEFGDRVNEDDQTRKRGLQINGVLFSQSQSALSDFHRQFYFMTGTTWHDRQLEPFGSFSENHILDRIKERKRVPWKLVGYTFEDFMHLTLITSTRLPHNALDAHGRSPDAQDHSPKRTRDHSPKRTRSGASWT